MSANWKKYPEIQRPTRCPSWMVVGARVSAPNNRSGEGQIIRFVDMGKTLGPGIVITWVSGRSGASPLTHAIPRLRPVTPVTAKEESAWTASGWAALATAVSEMSKQLNETLHRIHREQIVTVQLLKSLLRVWEAKPKPIATDDQNVIDMRNANSNGTI